MRNRRHLLSDHEGTSAIWPSFTDVMTTMALILFVLVLLAYVRSLVGSKRLDAARRQIDTSELQLRALRSEIQGAGTELVVAQGKLHDQEAVIADSRRQLDMVRSRLQSIAVLRVDVLNKVKQAIEGELGSRIDGGGELVTIGDNGNVVINESLVFEYNSFAIKPDARPLLDTLARAFGNVLADASVSTNIDTILIQGHTDERGSASFNWDLSAKRATSVLNYMFEANKALAQSYGSFFSASAYSKFRPIDSSKNETAYQHNRRIEISVIPKDDNVRKVIDEYVKSIAPIPTPAPPDP